MTQARATQSAPEAETRRTARVSAPPPAFAVPTPARASAATARRAAPCVCGGGCPRCTGESHATVVPADLRRRAETTLGTGLADVRLTQGGGVAAQVARRGADAGTRGNLVAFPRGLPDLSRPEGRFALGHELAHVAQQSQLGAGALIRQGAALEAAADRAGALIGGGADLASRRGPAPERAAGGPVQYGVFEAIGRGARAVNDVVAPVVDPVAQIAHQALAETLMNLLDVPALAFDYLTSLPFRALRLVVDSLEGTAGASQWLTDFAGLFLDWQGWTPVWTHLVQGVIDGASWAGELLIHALEIVGTGEFLQFLWARANIMAPLNATQIAAGQEVHPPGLIPYARVRVDYDSFIARMAALLSGHGNLFDQLFGTAAAEHRSVTTMHVIHTGHTMDEPLTVHELTHVGQYELVGAMYMAEAVHAQEFGQGYDYTRLHGSLAASIAAGATYADFNREQQASIVEDYYRARHGLGLRHGGPAAELEHFVNDYWGRAGIPLLRMFVAQ
jgi:hypothetical protein